MTTSRQHTKTWMTGLLCGTAIGLIAVSAAPAFAAEAPANDVEQVVVEQVQPALRAEDLHPHDAPGRDRGAEIAGRA